MYALDSMTKRSETEYELRVRTALKAAAYYRGMTAVAIAATVGVEPNTVGRWMRGERRMSVSEASALAIALNAPSDLFLRPPETRERALAMMATWDALREAEPPPA